MSDTIKIGEVHQCVEVDPVRGGTLGVIESITAFSKGLMHTDYTDKISMCDTCTTAPKSCPACNACADAADVMCAKCFYNIRNCKHNKGNNQMDVSKCGGTCKSNCQHYAIGVDCGDNTYQPSAASALLNRFGVTNEETRAEIKPLVLWMHDHGITDLQIQRDGTKALITINGAAI